ncbi:MarR family winged helix-turn-helix transcriptional regulator [Manganibacter manganicus]|uniref:MarR family transcriptional regulator n=1 Tax=Manganibacter manganicus TaxID=1873176 RepID=A0A1V8RQD2_9HYPH|nr:MarR family transcriptional regulator [Pseudaminobacter manganicus]OQM75189.1 MarR family transcriptional regulator [Pseudaminobacter manganicus]
MAQNIPLEHQLCFSLYSTSLAVSRLYKPLLDGLGITYPQYLVLNALWEKDGLSISTIAARLDLEPSTITPLVKRLEAASLVRRTRSAEDERSVRVNLTDQGKALSEQSRCLGETLFAKAGMTAKEMIALNQEVRRLRAALTAEAK